MAIAYLKTPRPRAALCVRYGRRSGVTRARTIAVILLLAATVASGAAVVVYRQLQQEATLRNVEIIAVRLDRDPGPGRRKTSIYVTLEGDSAREFFVNVLDRTETVEHPSRADVVGHFWSVDVYVLNQKGLVTRQYELKKQYDREAVGSDNQEWLETFATSKGTQLEEKKFFALLDQLEPLPETQRRWYKPD